VSEQSAELEVRLGELERERDEARTRADSYLELAQRSQADFANYKRRTESERAADAQRARAGAVTELLPLLDDLDRAVANLPGDLAEHAWAKGVALLGSRLVTSLGRLGVQKVGEVGEPFDPNLHEAVASEPRAGVEPGHVAEVYRPGYRSGDRLLRAAQVVVGADGEPPSATAEPEAPSEPPRWIDERA